MSPTSPMAVSSLQAPQAIGPYSPGIRCGELLFLSGQIALDPQSGQVVGKTVEEQTDQIMKNISALLEAAGLTISHVLKATVFMTDLTQFAAFNEVYGKHVALPYPARSTVQVSRLPKDVLVEIEVIAYYPRNG